MSEGVKTRSSLLKSIYSPKLNGYTLTLLLSVVAAILLRKRGSCCHFAKGERKLSYPYLKPNGI